MVSYINVSTNIFVLYFHWKILLVRQLKPVYKMSTFTHQYWKIQKNLGHYGSARTSGVILHVVVDMLTLWCAFRLVCGSHSLVALATDSLDITVDNGDGQLTALPTPALIAQSVLIDGTRFCGFRPHPYLASWKQVITRYSDARLCSQLRKIRLYKARKLDVNSVNVIYMAL